MALPRLPQLESRLIRPTFIIITPRHLEHSSTTHSDYTMTTAVLGSPPSSSSICNMAQLPVSSQSNAQTTITMCGGHQPPWTAPKRGRRPGPSKCFRGASTFATVSAAHIRSVQEWAVLTQCPRAPHAHAPASMLNCRQRKPLLLRCAAVKTAETNSWTADVAVKNVSVRCMTNE